MPGALILAFHSSIRTIITSTAVASSTPPSPERTSSLRFLARLTRFCASVMTMPLIHPALRPNWATVEPRRRRGCCRAKRRESGNVRPASND